MSNTQINAVFFETVSDETKDLVLTNIAKHYGCTKDEALEELLDEDAEHLLEYMSGNGRCAIARLMHG